MMTQNDMQKNMWFHEKVQASGDWTPKIMINTCQQWLGSWLSEWIPIHHQGINSRLSRPGISKMNNQFLSIRSWWLHATTTTQRMWWRRSPGESWPPSSRWKSYPPSSENYARLRPGDETKRQLTPHTMQELSTNRGTSKTMQTWATLTMA